MEGVREAGPDDVARLADLARAAITELTPTKGGDIWARREARQEPLQESLATAVSASDQHVLVGELDGAAMGYAVARLETLHDGTTLGVVDDLYVEAGAREVGLGEALMDGLLEWCRGRGCVGVDSLALPGNRETKNFFESFGLVARAIVVHKRL
jgi:ribosomal protein S18 acetylase RimI-like enzyme